MFSEKSVKVALASRFESHDVFKLETQAVSQTMPRIAVLSNIYHANYYNLIIAVLVERS